MTKQTCVLIEEDNMVASLVRFRLKRLNFVVHHLGSNLQELKTSGADIVLIGLHSRTLNTIEILTEIRAIIGAKIPVVVMVSNQRQKLVIENHKIQVDGYLSSPVNLSELENTIADVVNYSSTPSDELGFKPEAT